MSDPQPQMEPMSSPGFRTSGSEELELTSPWCELGVGDNTDVFGSRRRVGAPKRIDTGRAWIWIEWAVVLGAER